MSAQRNTSQSFRSFILDQAIDENAEESDDISEENSDDEGFIDDDGTDIVEHTGIVIATDTSSDEETPAAQAMPVFSPDTQVPLPPAPGSKGNAEARASVRITRFLAITIPRICSADSEPSLHWFKDRIGAELDDHVVLGGLVAREKHQDGAWHLHCLLQIDDARADRSGRLCISHATLDHVFTKHGNYQACRSSNNWARYCAKEDDFIQWGDLNVRRDAGQRHGRKRMIGEDLITGKVTLHDAVVASPELLFGLSNLRRDLTTYQNLQVGSLTSRPVPKLIYLMGDSGIGKTTMALSLAPDSSYVVGLPQSGHVTFNGYKDQELILFDNLSCDMCPPYDMILRIVDKPQCLGPVRYGDPVSLVPRIVVLTSIHHPTAVWKQMDEQMWRRMTRFIIGTGKQPLTTWANQDLTPHATAAAVSVATVDTLDTLKAL